MATQYFIHKWQICFLNWLSDYTRFSLQTKYGHNSLVLHLTLEAKLILWIFTLILFLSIVSSYNFAYIITTQLSQQIQNCG